MATLIIEPHYIGSLEYYVLMSNYDRICFEIHTPFRKQTYRNRAYILGSNKILPLIIPISYSSNSTLRDVRIDYSQRWVKDHWGAFYSSYGKAPFFEYFSEDLHTLWHATYTHLWEINWAFFHYFQKILGWRKQAIVSGSADIIAGSDYQDVILPKKPFTDRKIYSPQNYGQLFDTMFVPNLSILDLVMCEGPGAAQILTQSSAG